MDFNWNWESMCGPGGLHPWDPKLHDMGYCFQRLFLTIPVLTILIMLSSYYIGLRMDWVVRGKLQEKAIALRSLIVLFLAILPVITICKFIISNKNPAIIDYFTCIVEFIAWFIHFGYLLALQRRLGLSPRGPILILIFWSINFVLTVTCLHTLILLEYSYNIAIFKLILQILYAITLFPSSGVTSGTNYVSNQTGSQYSQLGEYHPLLRAFIDDYNVLGTAFSEATCLSKLFISWAQPLFVKGLEGKINNPDDLFDLPVKMSCTTISTKIEKALIGNVDKYSCVTPSNNYSIQENSGNLITIMVGYGSTDNREPINSAEPSNTELLILTRKHNVSLFRALHSCFGVEFYSIGILKLLADISNLAGPLLLNQLVKFVESPTPDMKLGYLYAGSLFMFSLIGAFCDTHFNLYMSLVGLKMRTAIISTIVKKTLSVTSTNLNKNFSIGQVTNFMSTDTDRIINSCPSFHAIWSIPLQLGLTLYLLYVQVGISFLAGVLFSIILIPINKFVANKIGTLSASLMRHKDTRVNFLTEVIKNIKIIKLYVWEDYFLNKVTDARSKEIRYLKARKYLDAICVFFWATTPVIITVLTLTTYVLLNNKLTASTVFTTIALFNMLISPLNAFPWVLNGLTEAWVSMKRVQKFLDLEDLQEEMFYSREHLCEDKNVLSLKHATCTWPNIVKKRKNSADKVETEMLNTDSNIETNSSKKGDEYIESPFKLIDLTFEVARGEFLGIVGSIGSGKSSLLNAILGEMIKIDGHIRRSDNIIDFAFVSQKPWLLCGTIKENILFGKAYEETKFRTVIDACCLTDDLTLLGCETQVGEGGNTLSGGQVARIALARAVYQDKQVYLLDDILSSVDTKVGTHIYRKCIMGLLKYKTRILITHSLQYLSQADRILIMENGRLKHQGPSNILLNEIDEYISGFDDSDIVSLTDETHINNEINNENLSLENDHSNNRLSNEEISDIGTIDLKVLLMYLKMMGYMLATAIFLAILLMQASRNTTDLWLSHWITEMSSNSTNITDTNNEEIFHNKSSNKQISYYLSIYVGIALANAVFTLFRAFLFAYGGIQAAVAIHKLFIKVVMKGKMKFFDITPFGRLLNRFSSDTYTVDDSLPFISNILLAQVFGVIGSIFITVFGLPWVCLIICPLMPVYHYLQHRYRITSRELKRLSSTTLSPLYSHFNDTLEGAVIIRAFGRSNQWIRNGEHYIERFQKTSMNSTIAAQWLSLRLQLIGASILASGALIAVIQRNFDAVNAGLVGLAISYALSVTSLLSGVINAFAETEREMIAVERINDYIDQIEPEEKTIRENETAPTFGWPSMGIICFNNVTMKYRIHLAPSLKEVSFQTLPGEKIGIVGRTGAGKSSLFSSLFRLSELHRGYITIDSIDIKNLTLSILRSRIAIIPQNPFIFDGSIRENLDPCSKHTDIELWNALDKSGAKQFVQEKGGLFVSCSNLSRGHMQLICLSRAILQNAKVICIDEATSNIDKNTDRLIQETIRCVFRKSTVLTIAHRISTVLDSDRIMVMNDGQILEFDKPENLLNDSNSHFYHLMNQESSGV